jgi:hypothetical protein
MNKNLVSTFIALFCAGTVTATAGELVLFSAATAGADVWSWGQAQITQQADNLLVQEKNNGGAYGDVYTSDRCAYLPEGVIEINVASVIAGKYTLQVLALQGESLITSIDVIKNSTQAGTQTIPLSTIGLPAQTESILFKLWVTDEEGASIELKDLRYTMPFAADRILFEKKIDISTPCSTEKATWQGFSAGGGTMTLTTNETYGSVLFGDPIKKSYQGTLLIHATAVKGGVLTVQFCALDVNGAYLRSVDVMKRVPAGWQKATLSAVQWPAETDSFQVKVWLEGSEGASATIDQFVILK